MVWCNEKSQFSTFTYLTLELSEEGYYADGNDSRSGESERVFRIQDGIHNRPSRIGTNDERGQCEYCGCAGCGRLCQGPYSWSGEPSQGPVGDSSRVEKRLRQCPVLLFAGVSSGRDGGCSVRCPGIPCHGIGRRLAMVGR